MTAEPGITDQLDALVSGKRSFRRYPVRYRICVKGVEKTFEGLACDISEGGVLLTLSHEELGGESGALLGPAQQLTLVETHLRDNFDVHFPDQEAVAEARLVRLSVRPEMPDYVFLGCQFVHPLGDEMQCRMGLRVDHPASAAWDDVEALVDLPYRADPRRTAYLMITDTTDTVAGPSYMGVLTALGPDVLVARVEGTDCESVTAALAGKTLQVCLMHAAQALWGAEATLLATRYLDGLRQGSEIGLRTDPAPSRRVRKLFKRT